MTVGMRDVSAEPADFLASSGTRSLIAGTGDRRLAPLFTTVTEYVFDGAQRAASADGAGER